MCDGFLGWKRGTKPSLGALADIKPSGRLGNRYVLGTSLTNPLFYVPLCLLSSLKYKRCLLEWHLSNPSTQAATVTADR